jgi:hypothetical protein
MTVFLHSSFPHVRTTQAETLHPPPSFGQGEYVHRILTASACALATAALLSTGRATAAPAVNAVAPGGNFDLSHWRLQLPIGSPGKPTEIAPAQLKGASGFQDAYFYTDTDGSMTFWSPENGVHFNGSNYARSGLREVNGDNSPKYWKLTGTHKLNATVSVSKVPKSVCVGQIHLDPDSGSTKPLLELYYHSNGDIVVAIENSPAGGQTPHTIANVKLGTKWTYAITETGGKTIAVSINGATAKTYAVPSSFSGYPMYFKAGDYNQSSSGSSSVGALVHFHALSYSHS